ncbi:MAG: hypothetical protein GY716_10535 [bacterium]|nr:hypothetical protein [bacterium]
MPIPLVAFEEHYEAFFVWHHARDAGWLAESKNTLLHVDEHADLHLPVSREHLPARHDAVAAARYAYTCLNISSFIWPTVYAGCFDRMYWLRRRHEVGAGDRRHVKLSFDPQRLPQAWTKSEHGALEPVQTAPSEVACETTRLEPDDRFRPTAPLALDIDLDYFAVNEPADRPVSRVRLEESFAREVVENPYHWMRVEGYPFRVEQDELDHWVLIPVEEVPRRPRLPASRSHGVGEALERFGAHLDRSGLMPSLITICRSEYSGSTPMSMALEIELGVRNLLTARYEVEEHSLNDLLPAGWKVPERLLRSFPW